MKNVIILVTTLLGFGFTQAQAPEIQWQKAIGGTANERAYSLQSTTDGGYIIAGQAYSNDGDASGNQGGYDYWIVKINALGELQWQKSLGGTQNDFAFSIQQTLAGGYIVAGYTYSNDGDVTGFHGNTDAWIIKLNESGVLQWQKTLGGTSYDFAFSIQPTVDGGCLMAGGTFSNDGDVTMNHGDFDYWIVKLNASGVLEWQKTFGGSSADEAYSIKPAADGGYLIAGSTYSDDGDVTGFHANNDVWIVKIDTSGVLQWQKSLGGSSFDNAYDIEATIDGGCVIAGTTNSNNGNVSGNHGGSDYWIVKLDASSNVAWRKTFGGSGDEIARSIHLTTDGGYIIGGATQSNDGDVSGFQGGDDCWIIKLNASGALQWQKTIGGTNSDGVYGIIQSNDGGYVVACSTFSNDGDISGNHSDFGDYWIVKLEADGLANATFEKPAITVYPNPVVNVLQITTTSNFSIDAVKIIDLRGNVILEQTKNGNTINVEDLAQGLYIVETTLGDHKFQSKFIKK